MGSVPHIVKAALLAAAGSAHEAAGAHGGGGLLAQLGIEPRLVLAQAVGFLLLYFILRALLYRPVLGILEGRQQEIQTRYAEADKARAAADELRRSYEARLAQVETEVRDRIQEGIREGQAMRAELVAQAQQERERLLQQGYREIAEEREKMVYTVRERVADMAVEAAGRILSRSMDEAAQRALVQEFLASIPADGHAEAGR